MTRKWTLSRILVLSSLIVGTLVCVGCGGYGSRDEWRENGIEKSDQLTIRGPNQLRLLPEADSYVNRRRSNSNYGDRNQLYVDESPDEMETFLRFSVPRVTSINSAKLRLYVTNRTSNGPEVYRTSNTWSEQGVTWNNRPVRQGSKIADLGRVATGWIEIDVTAAISSEGRYSFLLRPDSSDGIDFDSREASHEPELLLNFEEEDDDTITDLRIAVYGDSRSNPDHHRRIVNRIAAFEPELVLHSGDIWDHYSSSEWRSHITQHDNLNQLLQDNLYLVARGNHESKDEVLDFRPAIVRNNNLLYSFRKGNVFVVSLAMDPDDARTFLAESMQSPEARQATWKIVFAHYPIYSAGSHGENGVPRVEDLFDQYGVDLYFCGHDHHYERSHQIQNGSNVDTGDDLMAGRGTVYIVTGGGGAPLYSVDPEWWTNTAKSIRHYVKVTVSEEDLIVRAIDDSGRTLDSFRIVK